MKSFEQYVQDKIEEGFAKDVGFKTGQMMRGLGQGIKSGYQNTKSGISQGIQDIKSGFQDGSSGISYDQKMLAENPPKTGDTAYTYYHGQKWIGTIANIHNDDGRRFIGKLYNSQWGKQYPNSYVSNGITFGYEGEPPKWDRKNKMWELMSDED